MDQKDRARLGASGHDMVGPIIFLGSSSLLVLFDAAFSVGLYAIGAHDPELGATLPGQSIKVKSRLVSTVSLRSNGVGCKQPTVVVDASCTGPQFRCIDFGRLGPSATNAASTCAMVHALCTVIR